jgi:hypothetical protein
MSEEIDESVADDMEADEQAGISNVLYREGESLREISVFEMGRAGTALLNSELEKYVEENKRLREALGEIQTFHRQSDPIGYHLDIPYLIAKEALEGG